MIPALLLAALLPFAAAEDPLPPRRVAIVAGVDHYSDPALQPLKYAVKDAVEMAAALEERGDFEVTLLGAERPLTRAELLHTLAQLGPTLMPQDTFLLYISGHGTQELSRSGLPIPMTVTDLYLLTSDSRRDEPAQTGLAMEELERLLGELHAQQRVVMLDVCYTADADGYQPHGDPVSRWDLGFHDVRLFAADAFFAALEDDALQAGVFSHFLLRGLDEGDMDGDGQVGALELGRYAAVHTLEHTQGRQRSRLLGDFSGAQDVVIVPGDSPRSPTHAVLGWLEGKVVEAVAVLPEGLFSRGAEPDPVDAPPLPPGPLSPGRYRVRVLRDGRLLADEVVQLKAGQFLDPATLIPPDPPPGSLRLALGPAWSPGGGELVAPFGARVDLTRTGPGRPFGRLQLGLSASPMVHGPVVEGGDYDGMVHADVDFASLDLRARLGWVFGGAHWLLGPTLEPGLLLRFPERGLDAGPLLAPGLHLRADIGSLSFSLDPSLALYPGEGRLGLHPLLVFSAGLRQPCGDRPLRASSH